MSPNNITNILNNTPVEEPRALISLELGSFLNMDLPTRELILFPWLPTSGLCMIHAYRGIGKTHLALGIAVAVASGGKILNWQADKSRNVLYIDGEMPASVLQERLANILLMMKLDSIESSLKIITPDVQKYGMPDLATKEGQELINKHIKDEIDLIIIDNLSCLAPSVRENDATDWAIIQTWALGLRARGKSVLLIHHSGKSGAQRGTSKKEDVLDTVIVLERPKDYRPSEGARFIVKFEKARGFLGEDAKPFEAQLCEDEQGQLCWTTKPINDSTYEKVVALLNENMAQKEIATALDVDKSTVSRYTNRAIQEGRYCQQEDL